MQAKPDHQEKIAMFSPYVFEPCVRQMLMALLNAHILVIVHDEIKQNTDLFAKFLHTNQITYLNGTASVLQTYNYAHANNNNTHLNKLIFAGEELTEHAFNTGFEKPIVAQS